jgi:hypothetical protein
MGSVEEPPQQLAEGQPGASRGEVDPRDTVILDQLPPAPLGEDNVAPDRERALNAPAADHFESDHHPDLPHPRRALPDRPGASAGTRPPRVIPITRRHPYS